MTDPELARETAEKIRTLYRERGAPQSADALTALILAAFARRDAERRLGLLHGTCSPPGVLSSGREVIDAAMGTTFQGGDDNARQDNSDSRTRDVTPAIPSEPASRAVPEEWDECGPLSHAIPITPGMVVKTPCWLWHSVRGYWIHAEARDYVPYPGNPATHYHLDQPTAPTCRPPEDGA